MNNEKLQRLKADWDVFKERRLDNRALDEWKLFLEWKRKVKIPEMRLDQYTDLRSSGGESYFTHLMERKTSFCGKFRAASSYGYGVYRAKPKNGAEQSTPGYYTAEQRGVAGRAFVKPAAAEEYFKHVVQPILDGLTKFSDYGAVTPLEINFARKVAYMYNPGRMLALYKNATIRAIASYFDIEDKDDAFETYKATEEIKTQLDAAWSITIKNSSWATEMGTWGLSPDEQQLTLAFELSQKLSSFLFRHFGESFEMNHKNIIFYGAPGTGKTHQVEQAITQIARLDGRSIDEMRQFVQFHPSYTYEDFIEGLKPVNTPGGISLELQSGMFKRFCRKAMEELRAAREAKREPLHFYFIADEINRAELSRVLGEVLVCLEESKRVDFDDELQPTGLRLKTQYGHQCKAEDAVLTVNGEHYFGIPANLFFIGTMNDIDRSIDSFDMALRRRFVWQRMDCNYGVVYDRYSDDKNVDRYVAICKNINYFIREKLGLGYAYEIGQAYFMDIDKKRGISEASVRQLFDMKIAPLLSEYLRAVYSPKDLEGKLKEAAGYFALSAAVNAEE